MISTAPTKEKSREPAYSQAFNQNKIVGGVRGSRSRKSGSQTVKVDGVYNN